MRRFLKTTVLILGTAFTLRQIFFLLLARIDFHEEEVLVRFWDITVGALSALLLFGWFHGRLKTRFPRGAIVLYCGCFVAVSSLLVALHVAQAWLREPPQEWRYLKNLEIGCWMYADEHAGKFPSNWGDLMSYSERVNTHIYGARQPKEPSFTNLTAWADYVYVSGLTTASPPDWVLAFGRPKSHREGAHIPTVFVGGNVQWLQLTEFTDALCRNSNRVERTSFDIR